MVREIVACVRVAGQTGSANYSFFQEYTLTPGPCPIGRPHVRSTTDGAGTPL
jgi:hypothetical protein